MNGAQLAVASNAALAIFYFALAILILFPLGGNPTMTRVEYWLVRLCFSTICIGEGIRHFYLAWRQTYGYANPSQNEPISIVTNLIMVAVIPVVFVIAWRMAKRAYRDDADNGGKGDGD